MRQGGGNGSSGHGSISSISNSNIEPNIATINLTRLRNRRRDGFVDDDMTAGVNNPLLSPPQEDPVGIIGIETSMNIDGTSNEDGNIGVGTQSGDGGLVDATPLHSPESSASARISGCCKYVRSWQFVELLLCAIPTVTGITLEWAKISPKQRPIPYQELDATGGEYIWNQVYSEEYVGETVPTVALLLYSIVFPLILQLSLAWFNIGRAKKNVGGGWLALSRKGPQSAACVAVHKTLCVYLLGFGITVTCTNALKLYMGYLRPIFYSVCEPQDEGGNDGGEPVCTSSDDDERSVRLSFPSGHASLSFCGLLLLSQYLDQECWGRHTGVNNVVVALEMTDDRNDPDQSGNQHYQQNITSYQDESQILHPTTMIDSNEGDLSGHRQSLARSDAIQHGILQVIPNSNTNAGLSRIVSLLCYTPMVLALFIAASRVADNKHFPADVVGGALLGGSIALLVFGIWFPKW